MIENEEAIKLELDNTVNDEGCMRDYKMILQLLNQQTSTDHRVSIKAMEELRTIAIRDLGRMIDSMINISCLAERFEIPDQVFNHLSVTLSSYIKEISLSSDSEEDKKLLIRWLNKISYSCFRANSSLQLKKNIAVSFCRLLAHNEFFDDILFSDEVYFRYVKKFLTGTENEAQLNTSIMICESFLNEDTHLIIAALPKFVVDAVESFSNCGSILLETIFTADFQKSLECLDRINRVICSLLVVLVEEFTKYSRQALETLSSFHLCKYLRKIAEILKHKDICDLPIEKSLGFRNPIVESINRLITIARRFEIDIRYEATEHQASINKMIGQFDFRETFGNLAYWSSAVFKETIEMVDFVQKDSPEYAKMYLNNCLECIARSLELPVLSLDIQREADQVYLRIASPVIFEFCESSVHWEEEPSQYYTTEKNYYRADNYDTVISCACSILIRLLESCGLCQRIGDLIDRLSNHILGRVGISNEDLSLFLPKNHKISAHQLVYGFLIITNACAREFSFEPKVQCIVVSFFEESFFEFEKQLSRDKDLLYKLMFVLDTGKDSLDLISAQCFLRIYRWLVSFYANIPEGRQTKDHEILSDLSNQILKRIVECKLLIKRLRLNAYETLSSFDYVIDCNYESYFSFLGSLLQSPISKEYAKYSGKILALIVSRIEKEYVNLRMSRESSTVTKICDCFQLVKHVIEIKGVLDDEYSAIETQLAKILLYLKAPHKIDFDHYVLSIASKIVKTAGSHLTLLDPVIASLPQIFESNTFEIQTLYELFYAYILKDSNFALKENLSKISNLTKGINANDQTSIMKQEKESLSAFATINRILIITIEKSQNVSLESFEMAMFLIILEFQVYNEAGLLTTFKEILDKLLVLQIDLQSRLNLVEFSESTFKRYVWVSLALLNALHYYFEDVMGPYVQTGFIDNFIEKGLEIIIKASPSFPPVLSKLFRLCLLRLLGSGNNLKLSDNTILGLFQLITDLLFNDISREDTLRRVPDQFIGNKISKKFKSGLSSNVLKDQNDLNHLFISLSSIPDHQENDFYSTGINLYGYLQTIYRQMKEQLPALSELLKSNFTAEDISKLEQILSVRIINGSTDIFKSSKSSNHDYQQKSFSAPTPRKIAKVVRNNQ